MQFGKVSLPLRRGQEQPLMLSTEEIKANRQTCTVTQARQAKDGSLSIRAVDENGVRFLLTLTVEDMLCLYDAEVTLEVWREKFAPKDKRFGDRKQFATLQDERNAERCVQVED